MRREKITIDSPERLGRRRERMQQFGQSMRVSELSTDPHSCSQCRFYTKAGTCELRKQVIRKHGQKNLQKWLMNSRKRNTCSFYDPKFSSSFFSSTPLSVSSRGHIRNPHGDDVAFRHQLNIALKTLKMNQVFGNIMGGMNHHEAIKFLIERAGYSAAKVRQILHQNGFNYEEIDSLFKPFAYPTSSNPRIGKYNLHRRSERSIDIIPEMSHKHSQSAIRYDDGNIAYDHPEQVPPYVRTKIKKMYARPFTKTTNPDDDVTDVIFRVWRGKPHTVIALFPYVEDVNYGKTMMYEHLGQHGEGDYSIVYGRTRLATPSEYADLKRELESIGYKLRVIQRANHSRMSKMWSDYHRKQNAGDIHIDIESHRGSSEENPSRGSRIRKAINAHTKFNFKEPRGVKKFNLPIEAGDSFFFIGGVPQINYLSSKEGKKTEYYHKFHSPCVMYADSNKKCLIIMRKDGKPFQITDWFYK